MLLDQQVFQELKRYGGLLSRPTIASTLAAEKEQLAKQVDKHLDNVQVQFDEQRSAAAADGASGEPVSSLCVECHLLPVGRLPWSTDRLSSLSAFTQIITTFPVPCHDGHLSLMPCSCCACTGVAPGGRGACNVADHIMWCLRAQQRLVKTQEVVGLMLGPGAKVGWTGDVCSMVCTAS